MHTHMKPMRLTLLSVVVGASLLAGCGRQDERSAGQKVDDAVAKGEQKGSEMVADVRQAGRDVKQAVGNAADNVASKSKDAAITAEIKAKIARDDRLSALAVDVDTADGRVALHGTAPDTAARTRATEIARAVTGVVDVDNELSVQQRSN